MTFGKKLKELRRAKGIVMRGMIEVLDIAPSEWSKVERDIHKCPLDLLPKIGDVLEASEEDCRILAELAEQDLPKRPETAKLLPAFVTTTSGEPLTDEQYNELVEFINEANR